VPSGIYNLGSGVAISNIEVVKIVERVLGRKVNVVFRSARPFDVEGICLDCSALRQASGWKEKYSMEDGIREMAEVLVDRS
jgi:nucleoside-diphosphate-sugar epimerase